MKGRIGTPLRTFHLFYDTPLYNEETMKRWIGKIRFSESEEAQLRLEVINFFDKYGLSPTIDAYGVSRATIFRWKKKLKSSNGSLQSLIPKSRAPKRKRKMTVHPEVIEFIRRLRKKYLIIGKEKIKPLLDEFCMEKGINTISTSTIGKVIKCYNLTYYSKGRYYHNPNSKFALKKRNYRIKVKHSPRIEEAGYIEMDTITKFRNGIKLYVINAIDVKLKFKFAYAYTNSTSRNTLDFFKKLTSVYPYLGGIKVVQTDNGHEFLGVFDDYLKKNGIVHKFIYPRCTKINACIERSNRTLLEEFLDSNFHLLNDGINVFNSNLIDYLIWYNTNRVHKSLGNLTPINYLLKCYPESQMYATYTFPWLL